MSYRDDNDAARARADALQRDLDDAQEELAATKMKLAASEHDRTDLVEKIAHAPPPSPLPIPPSPLPVPPEPVTPAPPESQTNFARFLLYVVVLVIMAWLRVQLQNHR